jgi:hypothetical protein
MRRKSKTFAVFLTFTILTSCLTLLTVKSVNTQSIPTPAVHEFSVKYVDYSYDVPPTYGVDQFTGKQTVIADGYHVNNETFEFTIKNQPFTPYVDSNGHKIHLLYNFRFKGHSGTQWIYFPFSDVGQGVRRCATLFCLFYDPDLKTSNSSYTTITEDVSVLFYNSVTPSIGSKVDFQVQALIGDVNILEDDFYSFIGQKSGWSNTQTITLQASSPSSTPTPAQTSVASPSPTVPELSWLPILPLLLSVFAVTVMIRYRKTAALKQSQR